MFQVFLAGDGETYVVPALVIDQPVDSVFCGEAVGGSGAVLAESRSLETPMSRVRERLARV